MILRSLFRCLLFVMLLPFEANAQSGLVINEVFIGSGLGFGLNDQFVELYNGGTQAVALDGMLIVRFGSSAAVSGKIIGGVQEAWKFPGQAGGKSQMLAAGAFAVVAVNARAVSGGVDLSTARYETVSDLLDADNSAATNLTKVVGSSLIDLNLSKSSDAIVLVDASAGDITKGVDQTYVIDAVQYSTTSTNGRLPVAVDAGIAGGSGLKTGISLERATLGVSSKNSKADLVLTDPTPGFQHGTAPDLGNLKVTDLFPLDLARYVDYDSYVTDSAGTPNLQLKSRASVTVVLPSFTFEGIPNVAEVRDTSNKTQQLPGTVSDLHYRASAEGDVQVFADRAFFGLFVPAAFGLIIDPPNVFVDYLKLSAGFNKTYMVLDLNQDITVGSSSGNFDLKTTARFAGVEPVEVPAGAFDSAYVFYVTAVVKVGNGIINLVDATISQKLWLVKGIGIVKSNAPAVAGAVPIPGTERRMIAHGVRSTSGVAQANPTRFLLYPNPAADHIVLTSQAAAARVLRATAISSTGVEMWLPVEIQGDGHQLSISALPAGAYTLRLEVEDADGVAEQWMRFVKTP